MNNATPDPAIVSDGETRSGEYGSGIPMDDEIIKIVKDDYGRYSAEFRNLNEIRKKNLKYYKGDQIDTSRLTPYDSKIIDNRIFLSIETMIPIITAITPNPWVIVKPRNKRGIQLADKITRHLRDEWEVHQKMQQKAERLLRQLVLSRFAVLKIIWDEIKDDFKVMIVHPSNIRFDMAATDVDELDYVIEDSRMSIDKAIVKFPRQREYLEEVRTAKGGRSKIKIREYWGRHVTPDKQMAILHSIVYKDRVLFKEINPYWNSDKMRNHFKLPKFPYIFLNAFNTGASIVDDTSLVEQVLSLQDLVNKRKRQIDKNASRSNGMLVTSSQYMGKAEFDQINFVEKEKVYLNGEVEDVHNAIKVLTPKALDAGVYNDLIHSTNEVDNIIGIHSTTRGERTGEETAMGRKILRDADYGRLDLLARAYEQVSEELYRWMIQMMYVKYSRVEILSDAEPTTPDDMMNRSVGLYQGEDDDIITRDEVGKYRITIIVKKGSTRPLDPAQLQDMAVQLMQVGQLDPLTFHEAYRGRELPDPRVAARRLYLWRTDPSLLFPELQSADLIDYSAIRHIEEINRDKYKGQDDILEMNDPERIEEYQKHINTHTLYMKGVEIDAEIEPYSALDDEIKEAHSEHLRMEQMALGRLADQARREVPTGDIPLEASDLGAEGNPPNMPEGGPQLQNLTQ